MAIKPFLIGSWDKSGRWSGLLSFETSRKLDFHNYKSLVKATTKKENKDKAWLSYFYGLIYLHKFYRLEACI
ncbi:MAG TPA: hypothetical protein DGP89_08410 [Saprospirales bacterium]|nr:hypothetical protein [Saprospirales bacterium]